MYTVVEWCVNHNNDNAFVIVKFTFILKSQLILETYSGLQPHCKDRDDHELVSYNHSLCMNEQNVFCCLLMKNR